MTSDPTAEQLAELVALAEAATPGPWLYTGTPQVATQGLDSADPGRWYELAELPTDDDARYIAAANPAVIGPLARDVSQLRDRVAELTEALETWRYVAERRLAVAAIPDWVSLLPMTYTALYGDAPVPPGRYEFEMDAEVAAIIAELDAADPPEIPS